MAAPSDASENQLSGSPASTKTPITSGISLSENDCASWRKWMNTRHHSPTANPATSNAIERIATPPGLPQRCDGDHVDDRSRERQCRC